MSERVADQLATLAKSLNAAELECLGDLLRLAATGISSGSPRAVDPGRPDARRAIISSMARICADGAAAGSYWRGRPPMLDAPWLWALQQEALTLRASAIRNGHHWFRPGGAAAEQLAHCESFARFVEQWAGPVLPSRKTSFVFYEAEGDRIEPHVDIDEFTINALFKIRHECESERRSYFYLYPSGMEGAQSIDLEIGEMLLFRAGDTVHSRSPAASGERVTTFSIGFQPRI